MDPTSIALVVVSISANLACFLLGAYFGRTSAYKTVRTFQVADTHVDLAGAKQACAKKSCKKAKN